MSGLLRLLVRALAGLVVLGALVGAAVFWMLYAATPPEPGLGGELTDHRLSVAGQDRTYRVYAPARTGAAPPLVVVFHGRMGSPAAIRVETGYEFDRLADREGFVVAYPQGVGGEWNGCLSPPAGARPGSDADDVRFFHALVEALRRDQGVDPKRVFVVGLSNGGQMVYRLALEDPETLAGAAVFSASLPKRPATACRPSGRPVPMMLVNGTRDPINPYAGGTLSLFGLRDLGEVRPTVDSAAYFARLAGPARPARTRLPARAKGDPTWVEQTAWGPADGPRVVLLSVQGGGHLVPQPVYRPRRLLGRATTAINGPEAAWAFFRRQPGD